VNKSRISVRSKQRVIRRRTPGSQHLLIILIITAEIHAIIFTKTLVVNTKLDWPTIQNKHELKTTKDLSSNLDAVKTLLVYSYIPDKYGT
jgi:hypothetical protein